MLGEVRSIDSRGCRGWARLPDAPNYPVTVHLVLDGQVHASAVADGSCDDETDPSADAEGWFVLAVPDTLADRTRDLQVVVGETGLTIGDPPAGLASWSVDEAGYRNRPTLPSRPSAIATERDGMALGLDLADVLNLLYLDILKRSADKEGMAHALSELAAGEISIEGIRKALLQSAEYDRLSLKAADAPGRIFANPLAIRSSARRQRFEAHADAFCRATAPMPERLLRFFPGLLVRPDVFRRIVAAADKGLPARELFCRALSHLSDRPALILPGLPGAVSSAAKAADGGETAITVLAPSPLFAFGWHEVEDPLGDPFRWMSQIGIILNPSPQRRVERIEVSIRGWYGALGQAMAVTSERQTLGFERQQTDDGATLLRVAGEEAGTVLDYLVLVGGDATCPYRYTGLPDPRLLCCTVSKAVFVYAEAAA